MLHWRMAWILPIINVLIAATLLLATERIQSRSPDVVLTPVTERVSNVLNFPARVYSYPAMVIFHDVRFKVGSFVISASDVGFIGFVAAFWAWIGWKLDVRGGKAKWKFHFPRSSRILIYSLWILIWGIVLVTLLRWLPTIKDVKLAIVEGVAELLWSGSLLFYYGRQLLLNNRANEERPTLSSPIPKAPVR